MFTFLVHDERLAIARLPQDAPLPEWAHGRFVNIARTPSELSIVCAQVHVPRGIVHDLGYKRYLGTRRPQGTRWQVIARNQGAYAWKTLWRFKIPMLLALLATFIAGGVMYVSQNSLIRTLDRGGLAVTFADGIVPMSVNWYCKIAFIFSMSLASTVVASDVGTGAFTFYFSRAVRVRDYVIGKLVALFIASAILTVVGPLLLAALRLGLSQNTDEVLRTLPMLGKAVTVGLFGALAYAAIPFGFSSLFAKRRQAMAVWATYYLIGTTIIAGIGQMNGISALAALDIPTALAAISMNLFDMKARGALPVSLTWAIVVLSAQIVAAIALAAYKVRQASAIGVGSS